MKFLDSLGVTTLVTRLKTYFALKSEVNAKQDTLVSGTNIKTVNNNSLLGSGNMSISVPTASTTTPSMDGTASYGSGTSYARSNHVHPTDTSRQATLVSGTNIKTVGGTSLLGNGDVPIGVTTFNGDTGAVIYTAPVTSVNTKTGAVSLTASDVSAVPTTRTVNGKALSSNITLSAADIDGIKGTLSSSNNLNDYRTSAQAGIYYCSQATNAPYDYGMLTVYSGGTGTLAYQTFVSSNNYFFTRYYASGSWTEWYKGLSANNTFELGHVARTNSGDWGQSFSLGGTNYWDATGVEMRSGNSTNRKTLEDWADGLVGTKRLTNVANGATLTITTSSGTRGFLVLIGAAGSARRIVIFASSSAGEIGYTAIPDLVSQMTLTTGTNTMSIKNNTSAQVNVSVFVQVGSVTLSSS